MNKLDELGHLGGELHDAFMRFSSSDDKSAPEKLKLPAVRFFEFLFPHAQDIKTSTASHYLCVKIQLKRGVLLLFSFSSNYVIHYEMKPGFPEGAFIDYAAHLYLWEHKALADKELFIATMIEEMFVVRGGRTSNSQGYRYTNVPLEYSIYENGFEARPVPGKTNYRTQLHNLSEVPWDGSTRNQHDKPKALRNRAQNLSDIRYGLPRDLSSQPFDIFRLTALAQGQAVQW